LIGVAYLPRSATRRSSACSPSSIDDIHEPGARSAPRRPVSDASDRTVTSACRCRGSSAIRRRSRAGSSGTSTPLL
jgi:hypothetical protein